MIERSYTYRRPNEKSKYELVGEVKDINNGKIKIPTPKECWTPRTQDTSWFVGKIIDFNVFKELNQSFYDKAAGLKDYGKDGMLKDVYELRKVAGFVKVNFGTK